MHTQRRLPVGLVNAFPAVAGRGFGADGGVNPALLLGRFFLDLVRDGGGGAGAVPCGLAPRGGRGLLRQEFGKVEGGLGGGDTHGSSFRETGSGQDGAGTTSAGRRGPCAPHPDDLPFGIEGLKATMRLLGGKDRGVGGSIHGGAQQMTLR